MPRAALIAIIPMLGAGAQTPPNAAAVRVPVAPVVDGRLDDAAWIGVPTLSGLVQREPMQGLPVSERTEVRIVHDDHALYIGAWLFDSRPDGLVVGQTLRDASLSDSDAFIIVLDTYFDRTNGFVFATTPAGIEYDGQVANEGQGGGTTTQRQSGGSGAGFNVNWDGSWTVATHRDESGWYVEMRIPFSTLRYGKGDAQTWGFNFERRIRRKNEQAVWAPIPRQFDLYRLSLAGTLNVAPPTRRGATVTPYLLGEARRDFALTTETDTRARVGGDVKLGITQNLTLDLTVNTDFAQAEVDDEQVNLTRFPLFFPEKRGFFLENAGTFAVGTSQASELFFSRRIGLAAGRQVPIRAGARVTGQSAGWQIGVLNIQTGDILRRNDATGVEETVVPANNFGVLRAYRVLGDRTRLGGILVSRINTDNTDDYNLTWGLDGSLGVGSALTLDGWAGLTRTSLRPDTAPTRGINDGEYGFSAGAQYVTRDWEVNAGYRELGNAFNPEVGFVNRRAYRHANARVLRHIRTDGVSWFREFRPHVSWNQFWSLDGFSESYLIHIDNHFAFANGAFFQLPGFNLTGEGLAEPFEIREGIVIPAGTYHNADWEFRANTDRSAPLSASGGWGLGGFYNGRRFGPNLTVSYRMGDRATASLRANWFDVRLDQGSFRTSVVRLNGSYAFSPRVYLQANVQYNDDTEDLGANLRLGWVDAAGTGLFVVYNNAEHMGEFERTGIASGPRLRQLVVKYSRLFELTR